MTLAARFATNEPLVCCVCRRRAQGIAHAPSNRGPWFWICSDADCISLAPKVYRMPSERLDAYEHQAALAAGDAVGGWLDGIGKTDLTKLSEPEWQELCHLFVHSYEAELRRKLLSNEPPF
jgi:hypothetical protein